MSASRRDFVISQLKSYNKDIAKKIRHEKYCKMAATDYAFYRGTDHIYWADFSRDKRLKKFSGPKTKTWLQGDLHAYNFGSFDNDDGDLVYGLNDFDEGVVSDYQLDVWRMAISLILISRQNGGSKKSVEQALVRTFAKSYLKQLSALRGTDKEDRIAYTADKTSPPLKDFMKEVDNNNTESRRDMLLKWTKAGKFNYGGKKKDKLGKPTARERQAVTEAIQGRKGEKSQYRRTLEGPLRKEKSGHFRVEDVARRLLAGTGSLGTNRYYVLLAGKKHAGKKSKNKHTSDLILDVKHEGQAAARPYLSKADLAFYRFDSEAARTVQAYRALGKHTDDYLGWVELPALAGYPAGSYAIRERSPEKDSYPALTVELEGRKKLSLKKKSNFESMCKQWGRILATSHARADKDFKAGRLQYSFEKEVVKRTKGKQKAFCDLVCQVAARYADQVKKDYQHFTGWFDTSGCPEPE